MDPNNNQPIGTNPVAQPIPQPATSPIAPPAVAAVAPTESGPAPTNPAPNSPPEAPKGKNSKVTVLLVILVLLIVGIVAAYVLFAKNLMNNNQKTTADNTISVLPSPTLVPTLAPEEDLEVASPEADLLEIEADVKGL